MQALDRVGVPLIMHVHDETVSEAEADGAELEKEYIETIMSRPIPWAPGLPLKAKAFISEYYKKG
jgi:DNA polymerase